MAVMHICLVLIVWFVPLRSIVSVAVGGSNLTVVPEIAVAGKYSTLHNDITLLGNPLLSISVHFVQK